MKRIAVIVFGLLLSFSTVGQEHIKLSKDFLNALKNGQNADRYVQQIAELNPVELEKRINTQEKKLAFWINIYNGLIQYKLQKDPGLYEDRGDFFSDKILIVAGEKVSFDNLEHGILRKGTSKYSLGYFKNPFNSNWAERYEVDKIDWRIHFALNCGASSCPPIRIYDDKTIYKQLNASSEQYLKSQVRYDKTKNKVYVPALMNWFRGDFEGVDGVKEILKDNAFIPEKADPEVEYNDYNWDLKLGTFYN